MDDDSSERYSSMASESRLVDRVGTVYLLYLSTNPMNKSSGCCECEKPETGKIGIWCVICGLPIKTEQMGGAVITPVSQSETIYCMNMSCPRVNEKHLIHPKESPVSQSVASGFTHSEKCSGVHQGAFCYETDDIRRSIGSMISVMLNNPDKGGIYPTTRFGDKITEYIRSILSSTLSTLVKEMEGLKGCRFGCFCSLCKLSDVDTSIHCSDCVMNKPMSGISAAVEVVKKIRV